MNEIRDIKIAGLALKGNVIAAPMAGLSSLPYRLLAIELGASLVMSEMVVAEGIIRACAKTAHYFTNDDRARPFGVQVFGAKPDSIAKAIEYLDDKPIDAIDINMGCPVKKVYSKGAGSALMKDLKKAEAVIAAARGATKKPLFVKMRAGWDADSINCVELAKVAEGAGADAVPVHGRTRTEEFRGRADWSHIARVKAAVSIPVIGNGDIKGRADAIRMIAETGCDAVMVGRAAVGNPWIFREITTGLSEVPSPMERGHAAVRHLDMLRGIFDEKKTVMSMRCIIPWYTKGMPNVKAFMREAYSIKGCADLKAAIANFFGSA